jgi:hypothetical protein
VCPFPEHAVLLRECDRWPIRQDDSCGAQVMLTHCRPSIAGGKQLYVNQIFLLKDAIFWDMVPYGSC